MIFDAPDLELESTFWAVLLDGTVDAEDDLHSVLVDGEWRLGFQLAPNHVRPAWPDGPQQQAHRDVWVDDLPSARAKAIALGAIELQPSLEPEADEQFIVGGSSGPPVLPELGSPRQHLTSSGTTGRRRVRCWPW